MKQVLLLLFLIVYFSSCQKEASFEINNGNSSGNNGSGNNNGGGTDTAVTIFWGMKGKLDGIDFSYADPSYATFRKDSTGRIFSIAMHAWKDYPAADAFGLEVYTDANSGPAVTTNTYSTKDNPNRLFASWAQETPFQIYINKPAGSNPLQVTITNITDTSVSGTFKGELFLRDTIDISKADTTRKKAVTDGIFNIKKR